MNNIEEKNIFNIIAVAKKLQDDLIEMLFIRIERDFKLLAQQNLAIEEYYASDPDGANRTIINEYSDIDDAQKFEDVFGEDCSFLCIEIKDSLKAYDYMNACSPILFALKEFPKISAAEIMNNLYFI